MKSLFCRAMVILSRFGREVAGEEKGPIASCLCLKDFYQYVAFEESVLKSLNDSELKMGPVSPRACYIHPQLPARLAIHHTPGTPRN